MNRIIISGGGTGGHIYPALAIADELKERHPNLSIRFVGAYGKMEMEKVPQAGYPISGLWIEGLHRNRAYRNVFFPFKLGISLLQSFLYFIRFRPQVVVGTGGFASGPLVFVASLFRVPALIQEQNSFPGITNRLLGRFVNTIAVSYPKMERFFPEHKIMQTGNPTRKEFDEATIKAETARTFFGLKPTQKTVIILGGSLGAKRINELVAEKLPLFEKFGWQLIWQCGKLYYGQFQSMASPQSIIIPFVKEMNQLYAAADLIISRAGASTISELALIGKAVLFIPSPNVAEDHQMKNAKAVEAQDAAKVLAEKDLEEHFDSLFEELTADSVLRFRLGTNIKRLAEPNAVDTIVNEIESLVA